MKTKLLRFSVFMWSLLALITGCSDDEKIPDQIILSGDVSEIIFTPDDATSREVSFSTTTLWSVSLDENDWVEITPKSGPAGAAVITVKLLQTESSVDREVKATISAGTAIASLRIIQKATPVEAQSIRIVAPQKRLTIEQIMSLSVEAEPAGAILPEKVIWNSSDPAVLSVDDKGVVTAHVIGTAVVTAQSGNLKAECELEVTDVFTTDGEGRKYTFADLSKLESSGVQAVEGGYTVTANFIIAEEDTLSIEDGEKIRICHDIQIKILGKVDFTPESSAEILPYDNNSVPAPLYFTGEVGGGEIRNVTFTACPIRFFGSIPLTIEKCTFKGITDSYAAINLGGSGLMTVSECDFLENGYPAII